MLTTIRFPVLLKALPIGLVLALASCSNKNSAAPNSEPGASVNAEADSTALLVLSAAGCKDVTGILAWACNDDGLRSAITGTNAALAKAGREAHGSSETMLLSDAVGAAGEQLEACLGKASGKRTCILSAYATLATTAGLTVPGAAAPAQAPSTKTASSTRVGAYSPHDYRTMTLNAYKAMQLGLVEEAKVKWAQRLPDLKVVSDCSAPNSPRNLLEAELPELEAAAKACNGSLPKMLQDGASVRRGQMGSWVHAASWDAGCTAEGKWMYEQCVEDLGESHFPAKPHDFTSNVLRAGTNDEKGWNETKAVLEARMTYIAMAPANLPGGWVYGAGAPPLSSAADSGFPEIVRLLPATGYDMTQAPIDGVLTSAVIKYRATGCNAGPIVTEHCAARFEVIKTLVALDTGLKDRSNIYGEALEEAIEDKSADVVEFLKWAGATVAPPKPVAPVDPRVAACIKNVNRTLDTTTGQSGLGAAMIMQVQRHARAIAECRELATQAPDPHNSTLASVARQAETMALAERIGAAPHPVCKEISEQIGMLIRAGGNDVKIAERVEQSKPYGCLR